MIIDTDKISTCSNCNNRDNLKFDYDYGRYAIYTNRGLIIWCDCLPISRGGEYSLTVNEWNSRNRTHHFDKNGTLHIEKIGYYQISGSEIKFLGGDENDN